MITKTYRSLPLIRKFYPSSPSLDENIDLLVDVFAAFVLDDGIIARQEADLTLDLLRHAFPEVDHTWLSRRLEHSFKAIESLGDLTARVLQRLDKKEILELALQLYLVVDSSQSTSGIGFFKSFMKEVGLEKESNSLILLFSDHNVESASTSYQHISFAIDKSDIQLSQSCKGISCRIIKYAQTIVLKNTGEEVIYVSGLVLTPGKSVRFRPHQNLVFPDWIVSYKDICYFLNIKYGGVAKTIYLSMEKRGVLAERVRSKNTFARISFKLEVEVYASSKSQFESDNTLTLYPGDILNLPHYTKINSWNGATVSLDQLREQALGFSGRLLINQASRSISITNSSETSSEYDLKLTPNLAEPIKLKIDFDQKKAAGTLTVLQKGKALITVNNVLINEKAKLVDGAFIKLSSNQGIRCKFSEGVIDEERTIVQTLDVEGLNHTFSDKKKALDSINFSLKRGEMLCIMGPSGSGKSTLLSVLAGQLKPSRGKIKLNNISLYHQHKNLSHFISYLPQEQALFSHLTAREHLEYAMNIRQPSLVSAEVTKRATAILEETSLLHLSNRMVGSPDDKSLSGGERSRLNLGIDLTSNGEIYLLDEPIAGLSSKDSEHVTDALKYISRNKIVVVSMHRPSSKILNQFDKVLILDKGGKIAYEGTPSNMQSYFFEAAKELNIKNTQESKEVNADYIFDVIEAPVLELTHRHDYNSTRRFPSVFWQERFENHTLFENVENKKSEVRTELDEVVESDASVPILKKKRYNIHEYVRLFHSHFWRATLTKYRSKGTLYTTLLEVPLLAFIISWTLRASPEGSYAFSTGLHVVTYLFLTMTVGMFLGLTNSATEILRDRPTLRRERNYNYSAVSYVLAKLSSLSILSAAQCALYITIGNAMLNIEGMWLNHWYWMTLTSVTGTSLALLISAITKTQRAALSSVPLVLVPQLLLCGTPLIPFEEMNRGMFSGAHTSRKEGKEPHLSRMIPLRYAYEGIIVDQAIKNPFEKTRRAITAEISVLKKERQFNLDYLEKGLSDDQSSRLNILLKALSKLYAMEADSAKVARKKLQKVEILALSGTLAELDAVPSYHEGEEAKPCADFFVNLRTEQLVLKQDIQRVNLSNEAPKNIFLAEKKYLGESKNPEIKKLESTLSDTDLDEIISDQKLPLLTRKSWSTSGICMLVMFFICFACVSATSWIIHRSKGYK